MAVTNYGLVMTIGERDVGVVPMEASRFYITAFGRGRHMEGYIYV